MDLYLSDLHLGNPLFDSEQKVIDLIKLDYIDRIFLIGDVFDIWEDSFSNICENYRLIILEINNQIKKGKQVFFIKGNHDPEISAIKLILPRIRVFTESYVDKDIVIIHGNEFDSAILKTEWLIKIFYYLLVYPTERLFHCNIKERLRVMFTSPASRRGKKHYSKLVLQIEKDAVEKYMDRFKCIVMGHTHFPKIADCSTSEYSCKYINCGDWIFDKSYVIKDDQGNFRLEGEIRAEEI